MVGPVTANASRPKRVHIPGCRTFSCEYRVNKWLREWEERHRPEWAIPAYIVKCESNFTNEAPHTYAAGIDPSGYYQIISSTWAAYGGPTDGGSRPNASEWPRRVQDRIARNIVRDSPRGLGEWACA